MQADQLDLSYTELCHAMARVGEPQALLFLATLCLAMIAREPSADAVLSAIRQAEQQCC